MGVILEMSKRVIERCSIVLTAKEYYREIGRDLRIQGYILKSVRGFSYDSVKKENRKFEIICEKKIGETTYS